MKKFLFLIPIFIFVGCGSNNNNEQVMLEYAKIYYKNHMVMTNANKVSITKEMLNEVSNIDGYDMTKLDACKIDSKIIFTIKNKEIDNIEYDLNCN